MDVKPNEPIKDEKVLLVDLSTIWLAGDIVRHVVDRVQISG